MKRIYELKNNRTGEAIPAFATTVEVTLTDKELIFEFYSKNSKFFSACSEYNGPLFDGDVCEAFICTGADLTRYYEIEVAPNGCMFLEKIINKMNPNDPNDVIEEPIEDCFLTSEVRLVSENDYTVKFSMPLEKIGYNKNQTIRFNAFRIETEGGIPDKNLFALNPTLRDKFHCPQYFIELK